MKLSQRLLAGFLVVIVVLVALVVMSVDRRLRNRLLAQAGAGLIREARQLGAAWQPGMDADSLADAHGALLGHRVTLVDTAGRVVGDSEFERAALARLEDHSQRPEIVAAHVSDTGTAVRASRSAGDREIYAAVRHPMGVARVSLSTASHGQLVRQVQRDVVSAALLATLVAIALAALFARSVSRPILRLRDDAQAMAGGDLQRRPSLAAPGEVGELARAFHRLAEQLTARLAALEADEALLRAVSDSLSEGVVALDARQQVLHLNDGARELLSVHDRLPFSADRLPRDRLLRDALLAAMAGTATDDVETRLNNRIVSLTARPLAGGGAVLALFDVTPIRRLERMRRDFVANVSHELKTPLTVVSGFAETLRDDSIPAAQRTQFVETILSNTQRMQRLVDDLLDLSRIESGGWRPHPTDVDVEAMALEVLAGIAEDARGKGLDLRHDVHEGAKHLRVDAVALRQVLANLVHNALRHTTAGSITVFAEPASSGGIIVGVRDTGAGISAEHLPRVFERFYRADASRSRAEGGTGLGLAIVKHLVEAHGGRVAAESTVGEGTTVRAELPRA
ncbi:MAG: HAMP domain-containing protein [Gemmatimonadaceae bacterium]|nr:HAMP domain-containing protein [Gemmatimonadaceae bacterium]